MNIVILLTDHCNLSCDYCYYKEKQNKAEQTREGVKRVLDFALQKQAPGNGPYNLTFFGGEPLLRFDLIEFAVGYCRTVYQNRQIKYCINTNGTLLNKNILEFLNENNFRIYLSLDGNQAVHDQHRKTKDNEGSYPLIAEHFKALLDQEVVIEKIITPETVRDTFESVKTFLENDFFSIITAPDFTGNWDMKTFNYLKNEYEKLAQLYLEHKQKNPKFSINIFDDKIISFLNDISFKKTCCNMGNGVLAISTTGLIFPCTQFVNNDPDHRYCLGNINDGINYKRMNVIDDFLDNDKPECRSCEIKHRCLGNCCGCTSYTTTGSIKNISPFVCEHERMLVGIADKIGKKIQRNEYGIHTRQHVHPSLSSNTE